MIRTEADVTPAVLKVMEETNDPRLREIMVSLVRHLHSFVREVRLTEDEMRAAATIVNEIGQATTDSHNEAILMAGSLRGLAAGLPAEQRVKWAPARLPKTCSARSGG